ncbi:MAG: murein hydrolase activator EnvC family protein [Candidatus Dormibacterales bacterium]
MKARLAAAAFIASVLWLPKSVNNVAALYCYSGDPPAVYQACLTYNQGIGQQVNNENQLLSIQSRINDAVAQINAIDALISSLNQQVAAQQTLIAQTQATIDDLNRQIRFGQAKLDRLKAHMSVRDQLLNQRLRYVDSHGAFNYVELVLTADSFNQLMNRLVDAQQIAASDRRLLLDLQEEHYQITIDNTNLDIQHSQVGALLLQQKATEADLEKNIAAQGAAKTAELKLEGQLSTQYAQVQADRAAIDAQVAQEALAYQAAAAKAGGGSGVFEWPEPACGARCISQGYGCTTFYLETYDPTCPWPYRKHTGIDIAGPYGSQLVAADTGVAYLAYSPVGGNYVILIHGNGYSTYYGHLSGFAPGLTSGQVVARGTTIGFEGATGIVTGAHVHFEIRVNNYPKDPCIWLGC